MPVVTFRLIADQHRTADVTALLVASCRLFAEVLDTPPERVRAFAEEIAPTHAVIGGESVADSGASAPFFTFYLLRGRPPEHRQALLAGFTDLLVEHLGVERSTIRGCVLIVDPEDWAIAGVPAAQARRAEVEERARRAAPEK